MKLVIRFTLVCFLFVCFGCDKEIEAGVMQSDLSKDVELVTDFGTIILRLSDETPKHRNNFIKLVNEKFYDSIAFHRVIDNFMIQSGNPTSKPSRVYSPAGDPSLSYTIESEFRPNLFHKRGALAAARYPDIMNPNRLSSGFQFYIMQKGKQTDSTIAKALKTVNSWTAMNRVINKPEFKDIIAEYGSILEKMEAQSASTEEVNKEEKEKLQAQYEAIQQKVDALQLDSLAKIENETMEKYSFPSEHIEVYKSIGGDPRLDQNYTVFGEVVEGMSVVDSIARVKRDEANKPIEDVRIISARMIKRQSN